MGMFDTLHKQCPECGAYASRQTKSTECSLKNIFVDDRASLESLEPYELVGVMKELADPEPWWCVNDHKFFSTEVEAERSAMVEAILRLGKGSS